MDCSESKNIDLVAEIESNLIAEYGPILNSSVLWKILGYRTNAAFRQALVRKTVPVSIHKIKNRRGSFALSHDVAVWLSTLRAQ